MHTGVYGSLYRCFFLLLPIISKRVTILQVIRFGLEDQSPTGVEDQKVSGLEDQKGTRLEEQSTTV